MTSLPEGRAALVTLACNIVAGAASCLDLVLDKLDEPDQLSWTVRWGIRTDLSAFLAHAADRRAFSEFGPAARDLLMNSLIPEVVHWSISYATDASDQSWRDELSAWMKARLEHLNLQMGGRGDLAGHGTVLPSGDSALQLAIDEIFSAVNKRPDFWNELAFAWSLVALIGDEVFKSRVLDAVEELVE